MAIYTRADLDEIRERIGFDACPGAVADALGIKVRDVRPHYTEKEWSAWRRVVGRVRKRKRLAWAASVVQAKATALGYAPSERESGLPTRTIVRCGGYREIIRAAGGGTKLGKRPVLRPRAKPTPPPPPVTRVKHWQEVKR